MKTWLEPIKTDYASPPNADISIRVFEPKEIMLMKSIRWDNQCFIRNFVLGITKSPINAFGADIHVKDRIGLNPLFKAVEKDCFEVVQLLLAQGADVHIKEKVSGTGMIHLAAENESLKIMTLLSQRVDINERCSLHGATALLIATDKKNIELVDYLLQCGADPRIPLNNGTSALDIAETGEGYEPILGLFKKYFPEDTQEDVQIEQPNEKIHKRKYAFFNEDNQDGIHDKDLMPVKKPRM